MGLIPSTGRIVFLFCVKPCGRLWGISTVLQIWHWGVLSQQLKRLGLESDHFRLVPR